MNTAVLAIDQVRDTSESTGMMFFIEVMGRRSGEIALQTAVAAGAAGVLVPEEEEEIQLAHVAAADVDRTRQSGATSWWWPRATARAARSVWRSRWVQTWTARTGSIVLGHMQRGGRPTARDRIIASQAGSLAVMALSEGRSGLMIGRKGGHAVEVPLSEAVKTARPAGTGDLLRLAQLISG